eukprot:1582160-Amphidinium_carterae.1
MERKPPSHARNRAIRKGGQASVARPWQRSLVCKLAAVTSQIPHHHCEPEGKHQRDKLYE